MGRPTPVCRNRFLYLRMSERLATSIQELSAVDEELIDQHGLGILDGYTYEPQSWYYSWV